MPNKKNNNKPNTESSKRKAELPTLSVKIDRLNDYEGSKIKAFASANIGGAYAVHGIKVVDSDKGIFVSMPSTSYTAEAREDLNNAVLKAYKQELENQQAETQEEAEGMSQNM